MFLLYELYLPLNLVPRVLVGAFQRFDGGLTQGISTCVHINFLLEHEVILSDSDLALQEEVDLALLSEA